MNTEEQEKDNIDLSEDEDDERIHSRITDEENFAELPPIEVMNNM